MFIYLRTVLALQSTKDALQQFYHDCTSSIAYTGYLNIFEHLSHLSETNQEQKENQKINKKAKVLSTIYGEDFCYTAFRT